MKFYLKLIISVLLFSYAFVYLGNWLAERWD